MCGPTAPDAATGAIIIVNSDSARIAPGVIRGFDPQPDPPGVIRGFDPQPDPPGKGVLESRDGMLPAAGAACELR
jgi:hypothetical protein